MLVFRQLHFQLLICFVMFTFTRFLINSNFTFTSCSVIFNNDISKCRTYYHRMNFPNVTFVLESDTDTYGDTLVFNIIAAN